MSLFAEWQNVHGSFIHCAIKKHEEKQLGAPDRMYGKINESKQKNNNNIGCAVSTQAVYQWCNSQCKKSQTMNESFYIETYVTLLPFVNWICRETETKNTEKCLQAKRSLLLHIDGKSFYRLIHFIGGPYYLFIAHNNSFWVCVCVCGRRNVRRQECEPNMFMPWQIGFGRMKLSECDAFTFVAWMICLVSILIIFSFNFRSNSPIRFCYMLFFICVCHLLNDHKIYAYVLPVIWLQLFVVFHPPNMRQSEKEKKKIVYFELDFQISWHYAFSPQSDPIRSIENVCAHRKFTHTSSRCENHRINTEQSLNQI